MGQSGPDSYRGGVHLSPELEWEAPQPTLRWSMWVPQILVAHLTGNRSGALWCCSSPGQSRVSVDSVGILQHDWSRGASCPAEPRGDATFRRGGAPAWYDLDWPDSRPSSLVPAPSSSSQLPAPSSRKSLRGSRQRLGHQQEPIIPGRGPSRSNRTASRPASQPSCWVTPRRPQPILRSSRWI